MIKDGTELLPGWIIHYDEVSNNVWEVLLIDLGGRRAGIKDDNFDRAVSTCEQYAFDIEKQISTSFSKFLFEVTRMKLINKSISKSEYLQEAFGSWYIQINDQRLVYDGKDYCLTFQVETGSGWDDKNMVNLSELDIPQLNKLLSYFSADVSIK